MHTKTFSVDTSSFFLNKQMSQPEMDRKRKSMKIRNEVPEGGLLQGRTFNSVKKKLTFDEDFAPMMPYEAGVARKSSNPFVMLLQSGGDDDGCFP